MSGNVEEWTHSFKKAYPYKADDGRENEKRSGAHVMRGGSFAAYEMGVRCASRFGTSELNGLGEGGIRVVISPLLFA